MADKKIDAFGYELENEDGHLKVRRETIKESSGDYGADPLSDGTFRMVPSGDIVSFEERNRRLRKSSR